MTTAADAPAFAPAFAPLGTEGPRPAAATLDLVLHLVGPMEGRTVLDVGCGAGGLAAALAARGARVTGIDPQEAAVAAARARLPEGRFEQAGAEALPFEDESFDAVVFLNSLHHVPGPLMAAALAEAARVSRGPVLVVEPLAEGPFFEAMRPVEDETEIRAAAQAALQEALRAAPGAETPALRLAAGGEYDDVRRFPDAETFLARVVAVDPARGEAAKRERDTVAALMTRFGTPEGDLIQLAQPHRAHLLHRVTV